ncbi:glycosyltransferase (plasmid) [Mycetohabitans rhizoxinica]|uniref:Glycosyltransferase n=2 Tax=Mycetohabitans rhizoxinica TaxID=412963 RepID=A0ABZ2PRY2_9BURK
MLLMNQLSSREADTAQRTRIIFHITEFNDGGIESAIIQWLRVFDRKHFDVTLSVMFTSAALEHRFRASIPADVRIETLVDRGWLDFFQTRRHLHKRSKLERVARDIFNTVVVRRYVSQRIAHLAREHHLIVDFDMSLRRIAGRYGVGWLGVNHFSFNARLGGRLRKIRRLLKQYQAYDRIAALNEQMADEARAMFGSRLPPLLLLPNAIDIAAIRERASHQAGSASIPDEPYIVSVARLDEIYKDHRTLLRAYQRLVTAHAVREHLVIVGDGAFRAELEQLARELSISERVHFTGQLNNPHPVIAGATLQILSSRSEGMPMVLLEGLALGRPIIATDCPTGPSEILDGGRAGILVPVGDVDAMVNAMRTVLTDPALRAGLTERARQRAQHYGIDASNARLKAYVDTILASRRAVPTAGAA